MSPSILKRTSGLPHAVSPEFKFRARLPGQGNSVNSGKRGWWCLEVVSGWSRDVQRGEGGDESSVGRLRDLLSS